MITISRWNYIEMNEKNATNDNNNKITTAYYRIIGYERSWTFFKMAFKCKKKKTETYTHNFLWYRIFSAIVAINKKNIVVYLLTEKTVPISIA